MLSRFPLTPETQNPEGPYDNSTRRLWLDGFRPECLFKDDGGNTLTLWLNRTDDDFRMSARVKGKVIIFAPVDGPGKTIDRCGDPIEPDLDEEEVSPTLERIAVS